MVGTRAVSGTSLIHWVHKVRRGFKSHPINKKGLEA